MKIPKKLRAEPLVDAIFECRLVTKSNIPLSGVFPGMLFSDMSDENKSLERLPQYDIPEIIRQQDPNMKYMPLIKLRISDYFILIGDNSVAISCILPYKGWNDFKERIMNLLSTLEKNSLVESVERYSLKYIDIIEAEESKEQVQLVNISLKIGQEILEDQPYQVRMDIKKNGIINIVQILSNVVFHDVNGKNKNGVIIDIDSIKETNNKTLNELQKNIEQSLDEIHDTSKSMFFNCLTETTLSNLGAEYE